MSYEAAAELAKLESQMQEYTNVLHEIMQGVALIFKTFNLFLEMLLQHRI